METGLAWGVKASFLRYVASDTTSETTISAGAGELVGGGFYFTPADATATRLAFRGIVSFRAHGGLLRVVIADPVIDLETATMHVRVDEQGTLRPLVDLELPDPDRSGGFHTWHDVSSSLRPESVEAFGDVYGPGTPFDPVTLRIAVA